MLYVMLPVVSIIAAKAATGAVSVLKIRGPKVAFFAPKSRANCTSSSENPPSGPIKIEYALKKRNALLQRLSSAFVEEENCAF